MISSVTVLDGERNRVMNRILEKIHRGLEESIASAKHFIAPIMILAAVFCLGISSILRANFYYIDDFGRAYNGKAGWDSYSRHLSVFLSRFIHADNYLMDVSPLPQLLAVLFMAIAGVIMLYTITGKRSYSPWHFLAVIPLALAPHFLECLSYKYDAPYMALSVLVSVVPFLCNSTEYKKFILCSVLGTLAMCMTYQASSGIFPLLTLLLAVKRWNAGEKVKAVAKFVISAAIGYITGLLVFRIFIMEEYVSYSSTEAVSGDNFWTTVIYNYTTYIKHLLSDYRKEWLILVLCLCIGFIYVFVRYVKRSKIAALTVSLGTIVLLFLLAFGVYPFLTKPGFAPRCMYGIGVFIAALGIYIADSPKIYLGKLACCLLSWMFFVFSFSYGNALFLQEQYTEYRMELVIDDLVENGFIEKDSKITTRITGSIGYAPAIENSPADYKMLRRLVPVNFRDSTWYWGHYSFTRYYDLNNLQVVTTEIPSGESLPIISDNALHTIRGNEEYLWIDLH